MRRGTTATQVESGQWAHLIKHRHVGKLPHCKEAVHDSAESKRPNVKAVVINFLSQHRAAQTTLSQIFSKDTKITAYNDSNAAKMGLMRVLMYNQQLRELTQERKSLFDGHDMHFGL